MTIHFNSKSSAYSWLSNFFVSPMILYGKEYTTVEHWFQSQKFTDIKLQEKIRSCSSGAVAKKLGRTRDPTFRKDWDAVKESIMYEGLRAKFEQNKTLQTLLLQTGAEDLVEQSPWDSYWGSGRNGKGQNRMGFLLMKLRSELL